jgi:hypothetical protein
MEFKECACCGQKTLELKSRYDICTVCGWEDDPIQNDDPDYMGGANYVSLNIAKKTFAEGKSLRPLKEAACIRIREKWGAISDTQDDDQDDFTANAFEEAAAV